MTITGSNFGASQGASSVAFGSVNSVPASWSDTSIVVDVPSSLAAGSASVVVTANGLASNGVQFLVIPVITGVSPSSAIAGTQVTVNGSGFGPTQGSSTLTFNGVAGATTSWSSSSIVTSVPAAAATGPLTVTVNGLGTNSVWFTVPTPAPTISSISPGLGSVATSVTITGANFGNTQGSSAILFAGLRGSPPTAPTNWSASSITVPVPSGAITGGVGIAVNGQVSNFVNFVVANLNIASITPSTGGVGTQVTISGSGFGASQGSSVVTFNGTAASPTSWSDAQIVVLVPPGATTGPVQVTEAGVGSNTVSFAVATPPTIRASVFPLANANGWNNSNVTVTFTCTPGSSAITTCPAQQNVTSEGANQVISGTATDANGLTATTSVTLNIDKTRPILTVSSPSDGSVLSSSTAIVTGTVTDATSGASTVTCNGAPTPLSSGSFSCNISLNVGVNLIALQATDLAGNLVGSNFHVSLGGPLPAPASLQITPANLNILVAETQQFTATDDHGRPRTDATWTVSDTTLATITSDSSPTLVAVAVGQVTLTASVGSITAQTQVNILGGTSLPTGTARWSLPPASGLAVQQCPQAQPANAHTPDLYCVETDGTANNLIVALTADGQQMWTAQVPGNSLRGVAGIPDGNGGIIVHLHPLHGLERFVDLDAQTGTQLWEHDSPPDPSLEPLRGVAIGADATVYFREATSAPDPVVLGQTDLLWSLVGLDGATGGTVFSYPVQQSTQTVGDSIFATNLSQLSDPIVGPDGSVFATIVLVSQPVVNVAYNQTIALLQGTTAPFPSAQESGPGGRITIGSPSLSTIAQANFNGAQGSNTSAPFAELIGLIPDGQGGVLASWWTSQNLPNGNVNNVNHITHVLSGGASDFVFPFPSPFQSQILPQGMVLGENGTAFATDGLTVVSFDVNAGAIGWSYDAATQFTPVSATVGNGLVGKTTDENNLDTAITLNASGQVDSAVGTGAMSLGYSWQGGWYALLNGALSLIPLPPVAISTISPWAEPGGTASDNGKAVVHHTLGIFWCGTALFAQGYVSGSACTQGNGNDIQWAYYPELTGMSGSCPTAPSCGPDALRDFSGDHPEWVKTIISQAFTTFRKAYAKYGIQVQLSNGVPSPEYTVYVLGTNPFPTAGQRFLGTTTSGVYYFAFMEAAQDALGSPENVSTGAGWLSFSPNYPPPDPVRFAALITAIGTGIGNAAAHEIGHQLEQITNIASNNSQGLPFMDCGLGNPGDRNRPVPIACENNDNFVYGFFGDAGTPQDPSNPLSTGAMFFYGIPGGSPGVPVQPAIHWGPSDTCWIQNYVQPGSCSSQ